MKVLCFLDSEHYTDPEYVRLADDTAESEVQGFIEQKFKSDLSWECGKNAEATIEWMEDGKCAKISSMQDDGEFFIVCAIKEIPDARCISAYHHAYEGVGFEVKGFDTIEEARDNSARWADEVKKDLRKVAEEDRDLNFICIDDEYQWHMFTSQLVFETKIMKAAA